MSYQLLEWLTIMASLGMVAVTIGGALANVKRAGAGTAAMWAGVAALAMSAMFTVVKMLYWLSDGADYELSGLINFGSVAFEGVLPIIGVGLLLFALRLATGGKRSAVSPSHSYPAQTPPPAPQPVGYAAPGFAPQPQHPANPAPMAPLYTAPNPPPPTAPVG